jgi:hypothetical protein
MTEKNTISIDDYKLVAEELKVDPAAVMAIFKVEAPKGPFLPNGLPPILFEGHVMWKELMAIKDDPKKYLDPSMKGKYKTVLYPKWVKTYYVGGEKEYARLELASEINYQCALKSASWGGPQILGTNYKSAGFKTVEAFVEAMKKSAADQMKAFANFIKAHPRMYNALKNKNWVVFAENYNGPLQAQNNYSGKIEAEYNKAVKLF